MDTFHAVSFLGFLGFSYLLFCVADEMWSGGNRGLAVSLYGGSWFYAVSSFESLKEFLA